MTSLFSKSQLMLKIMKFTSTILEILLQVLDILSYSVKLKKIPPSFSLLMESRQLEPMDLMFMRNFYQLMALILKFTQLGNIMLTLKLVSAHRLMVKWPGIKLLAKKFVTQLIWPLGKRKLRDAFLLNSNKKYVVLICYALEENHIFVT